MGRQKRFVVNLPEAERKKLIDMTKKGMISARVMTRARVLLLADEQLHDKVIAERLAVSKGMISKGMIGQIRRKYATDGVAAALYEKPRPKQPPKLDPKATAILIAETCSDAPEGYAKWTMQLLADRLVALGVVDSISDETVRKTLKKTHSNPGRSRAGASPK